MLKQLKPLILLAMTLPIIACQAPTIPTPDVVNGENPGVTSPSDPDPVTEKAPMFSKALSKRSLDVSTVLRSEGGNATAGGGTSVARPESDAAEAPSAPGAAPMPAADIAIGQAAGKMAFASPAFSYYPGGGDFNSYIPVTAEELKFGGDSNKDLRAVYQNTVQPILSDWDSKARLLEARGHSNPSDNDPSSIEYIYLPGINAEQEQKFKTHWVFRFASTPRKETLSIYVNDKETRVYRTVYGEPNLDMSLVKISSDEAINLAEKAFNSKDEKPGYPVYPESMEYMGPNASIVYDLPANLNWHISLGQQGQDAVYYLNFDYREATGKPGVIVPYGEDLAQPEPAVLKASEEGTVTSSDGDSGGGSSGSSGDAVDGGEAVVEPSLAPCYVSRPYYDPYVYLNGSISIDANSGKILSLNRPVRYQYDYPQVMEEVACEGGEVKPQPAPEEVMVEETPSSSDNADA